MGGVPQIQKSNLRDLTIDIDEISADYLPVKVRDLFADRALPYSIFFPFLEKGKKLTWKKLLSEGEIYSQAFHDSLVSEGIKEVYIDKNKENEFFDYFNSNLLSAIVSNTEPSEKKTCLLYDYAENIVIKVFRERPTKSNIMMGRQFVENFAFHLTVDKVTSETLASIFSKDYNTFSHSVQVAILGMSFCTFLGWSTDEVIDFGLGALFHDVGKIFIDDSILKKPGRLDLAEFEVVKRHPFFGYNKLKSAQIMTDNQLDIVLHHHEDMNGLGYPDGLSGEKIHKYSRVARIVDCYDALTTKRPYKNDLLGSTAVEIMEKEMLQVFDQDLLKSFITFLGVDKILKDANRISLAVGNQVLLQPEKEEFRFKAMLVGMEMGDYLILRIPAHGQIQKFIYEGKRVIGRYMHAGVVYGFKTAVIGQIVHPLRLLILRYPESVEAIDLRKNPRIDCFFPADVVMQGGTLSGVILDISVGGCRFAAKFLTGEDLSSPKVGENVKLSAQLFGSKSPESLKGVVRNVRMEENKAELGVQFVEIAPEVKKDLKEFIDSVMEIVKT